MFKLVVFCAFIAAATAEPGPALLAAPITQYSTVVAPGSTSISKYDTSVIHPSPVNYYSALPLTYTHYIKKRSPQLPYYYTPSTYFAHTPYLATNNYLSAAPIVPGASILPAVAPVASAVHLIKKRSAPLLSPAYLVPQVYASAPAPIVATSYTATTPWIQPNPLISNPFAYNHLIKKRSAPLLSTYIAPAAYSHQSRFDLRTSHTPLATIAYNAPITYPLGYSHLY